MSAVASLSAEGAPRDCQVSLTAVSHQSVFSPLLVGSLGLTSGSQRRMWQHLRRVIDMSFLSGLAFPVGLTGVLSSPRKTTTAVQSPEGCLVGTVRAQAGGSTSECQWLAVLEAVLWDGPLRVGFPFQPLSAGERWKRLW